MKLRCYFREKGLVKNHAVEIVESDIACFKKQYRNLYPKSSYTAVNTHADEGDELVIFQKLFEIIGVGVFSNASCLQILKRM